MKKIKITFCQYKHLSCFGCCGYGFGNEKEFLRTLKENTASFNSMSIEEFKQRSEKATPKGGCKALIINDGRIYCPLHLLQNNGKDYRDENCRKEHLCEAFKKFMKWDEKILEIH